MTATFRWAKKVVEHGSGAVAREMRETKGVDRWRARRWTLRRRALSLCTFMSPSSPTPLNMGCSRADESRTEAFIFCQRGTSRLRAGMRG